MSKPPAKVVFVGNIPYGLSEEQLEEIFRTAGRVVNFRLVYDKETGRPKGFGFAEYPDIDSAASAVRNLNDYEIMNRKLRVDFSNDENKDDNNNISGSMPYQPSNGTVKPPSSVAAPSGSSTLPPLPPGQQLPANLTFPDAISRTLNTLPPSQMLDIIREMQAMAVHEPQRATELLSQAPQLAYAIFQAALLMGLVSPEAINSVLESSPNPTGGIGYPVPSTSPTPANAADGAASLGDDPEALMQAVMELPQETIDQLPEEERAQIMNLRASYLAQR